MLLAIAGDIHGQVHSLYRAVSQFEQALGRVFDLVLQVGDFGIWPDPEGLDRATARHGGAGDFPRLYADQQRVLRPTWFIKGNHEDFRFLDGQVAFFSEEVRLATAGYAPSGLLPGLHYIPNGRAVTFRFGELALRVGGVGGCCSRSDYVKSSVELKGRQRRHYCREELTQLAATGPLDILLLHDAPNGLPVNWRFPEPTLGLGELVHDVGPKYCFFGHYHTMLESALDDVPCVGLNIIGKPGHLLAMECEAPDARDLRIIARWPEHSTADRPGYKATWRGGKGRKDVP